MRLKESIEREQLLVQRAVRAAEQLDLALRNEHELREQIDRLTEFNRAVERSAPWRFIQFLRGFAGRKW
jgi:hypothetical protein